MKLFKPQLQLAKESELQNDGNFRDHYYLHVVIYADKTNYRTSDEDTEIDFVKLDEEGLIQVRLYLFQDVNIVDMGSGYISPLVYSIDLGTPVEKGIDFIIQVDVFKELPTRDGDGGSSGSSQTGSSGADETDRPIGS